MTKVKSILAMMVVFFAVTNVFYAANTENIKKAEIKSSAFTFEQKLKIEDAVWNMDGVKDASYNIEEKTLTVKYDENLLTTDMMMYSIITDLGLSAELKSDVNVKNNPVVKKDGKNQVEIDNKTKVEMESKIENELKNAERKLYEDYLTF